MTGLIWSKKDKLRRFFGLTWPKNFFLFGLSWSRQFWANFKKKFGLTIFTWVGLKLISQALDEVAKFFSIIQNGSKIGPKWVQSYFG